MLIHSKNYNRTPTSDTALKRLQLHSPPIKYKELNNKRKKNGKRGLIDAKLYVNNITTLLYL